MQLPPAIFDRKRLQLHRARAAARFGAHDFLLREMAERLCERLEDVTRRFPRALVLGAHNGVVAEVLAQRGGVESVVQSDFCAAMLADAASPKLVADEEALPFADDSFDLVLSVGSLQWVNDLPGALVQIRRILKPDGLLLAMLPGGRTLLELRHAFERAEQELSGGLSPRVSPFVDVKDSGSLLQRAGFSLPVVDSEMLSVHYQTPMKLLEDLRYSGQTNALMQSRKTFTSRTLLAAAMTHYQQAFAAEGGRVAASFELVTLTAWKPHASQPQALPRGSGQVSLAKALKDN